MNGRSASTALEAALPLPQLGQALRRVLAVVRGGKLTQPLAPAVPAQQVGQRPERAIPKVATQHRECLVEAALPIQDRGEARQDEPAVRSVLKRRGQHRLDLVVVAVAVGEPDERLRQGRAGAAAPPLRR
ncbi:hypothetical protein GCM10027610_019480 [Dactylosporangium cerinum]